MKAKWRFFLFGVFAILLITSIASCGESYTQEDLDSTLEEAFFEGYEEGYADALAQTEITEEEKPKEKPVETTDRQIVKEWTGEGIKTTEPFVISKQPWAISWVCNMTESYGYFSITAYTTENKMVSLVANTTQSASDVSYIYETGTFYLDIGGYGAVWAIQIVQFP